MSGGHFDYVQWRIEQVAVDIDQLIRINNSEELDEFGNKKGHFYTEETIKEFANAYNYLKLASTYVQRIDWLVSGDDGEDTFHKRLAEDLHSENRMLDKEKKLIDAFEELLDNYQYVHDYDENYYKAKNALDEFKG